MSENTHNWRLLRKNEWDRLGDFLESQIGQDVVVPSPDTTEVVVLVDSNDQILSAFACSVQVVFAPMVATPAIPQESLDAVYASGVEVMRRVCGEHGLVDAPIMAIQGRDKGPLMAHLGFEDSHMGLFVGSV